MAPVKEVAVLAKRAAELDDSDPWSHFALGYVAYMSRRTDDAKQEYERAIDLNPNFAAAYGYLGWAFASAGRTDEAIAFSEQAIRMSPHDPQNVIFNNALSVAHSLAGRYTEAISFARKAVQQRDGMTSGHRILVAEEARTALQRLKELQPNVSIAWCEEHIPYTLDQMPKFLEGLRKAGLQ